MSNICPYCNEIKPEDQPHCGSESCVNTLRRRNRVRKQRMTSGVTCKQKLIELGFTNRTEVKKIIHRITGEGQ